METKYKYIRTVKILSEIGSRVAPVTDITLKRDNMMECAVK